MRNFGTFHVRETKAKIGRNPKNPGKDVPIPARAAVKFKPGKEMKEKVETTLRVIRERR
jgi:DNA-binding protein HU-beta/integration host factor subunit alpha